MSAAAPANFNAEEADNLEDVRWKMPEVQCTDMRIADTNTDRKAVCCKG
jgi:hypothetical protein